MKWMLLFVLIHMISLGFANEEALRRAVSLTNHGLETINSDPRKIYCSAESACPKVIRDSFEDIYSNGTVGFVNSIVSDGSAKDPRTVCSTSASNASKTDPRKLRDQLEKNFSTSPQLTDYSVRCSENVDDLIESGHSKTDINLSQLYMAYDFNYKTQALKTAMTNLLDARAQVALISPGSRVNCHMLRMVEAKEHCENVNQCKATQAPEHYLNTKSEELSHAIQAIDVLQGEYNKLLSGTGRLRSENREKAKLIEENIKSIKDLNPLLKGEKFKPILGSLNAEAFGGRKTIPTKVMIDTAIKEQLKISSAEINRKLSEFNTAYMCLIGEGTKCDDFEKVMSQIDYQPPSTTFPNSTELNSVASFHQCIETMKMARNQAGEILDDVAIGAALSLTPYALVNGAKLAATMARATQMTGRIVRAENTVLKGGLVASSGYGGFHSAREFQQCQEEVKEFKQMGESRTPATCESMDRIFVNNSNNSRCFTQAMVSAVMMTPIAGKGLQLAQRAQRNAQQAESKLVKTIKENNQADQIISDQITPIDRNRVVPRQPASNSN